MYRGGRGSRRKTAENQDRARETVEIRIPCSSPISSGAEVAENYHFWGGGEGWIRTSVRLRGQIYSLLPLTTRPPLQVRQARANGGAASACQRSHCSLLSTVVPSGAAKH